MSENTKEKPSKLSKIFTKLLQGANYFFERISEASTMRAIIVLGSAIAGYSLDEGNIEHYILIGVVVAQTIALILPDKVERKRKKKDGDTDTSDSGVPKE